MAASADDPDAENGDAPLPDDVMELISLGLSKTRVRPYTEETFSVLADFGPADVNELRSEIGLAVGLPLSKSLSLRVSAAGEGWFYGYDGDRSELSADLGGAELFDTLYGAEVGLAAVYQFHERWSVFAEGRGQWSWEEGAPVGDAGKGSGAVGIGFEFDPRFSLALGVQVGSRLAEGGVSVQPVFGFRWKIRDGMRLKSNGAGVLFGVDLCPDLELQLRARYESDSHLLDERGAGLGMPRLRQRRVPVLAGLRWSPGEQWRIAAGAGSVVYQQWRVEAEQGGDSASVSAGPAALTWLEIEYRF